MVQRKAKKLTSHGKQGLHRLKIWAGNQKATYIFLGGFIVLMVFLILVGLHG